MSIQQSVYAVRRAHSDAPTARRSTKSVALMIDIDAADEIDQFSLMFECARSLIAGAKIIVASDGIEEDGQTKWPTIPMIVCSAFAIEVQIKALLQKLRLERPKGDQHDISLLFSALPGKLQQDLLAFQESYTQASPEQARKELGAHKDTFKRWRYPYESHGLAAKPSFVFGFALALSDYIKGNYEVERSGNGWLGEPDER